MQILFNGISDKSQKIIINRKDIIISFDYKQYYSYFEKEIDVKPFFLHG